MTAPAREPLDRLQQQFDALYERVTIRLETSLALIVATGSVGILVIIGTAVATGVDAPHGILGIAAAFFVWYSGVYLAIRTGFYRPWIRYVSSAIDVTLGTCVIVVDALGRSPAFAMSGGGPALLFLAVCGAGLRLTPRLSLYTGIVAALQYGAVVTFFISPAIAPAVRELVAIEPFVTLSKSLFLVLTGLFGMVATSSLRTMLFRANVAAFERERVRGLFGVYMSEEVVEHILAGGVREGGERRCVTICFTDVRDFTRLSESRPPEEILRLLNLYFDRMCTIVARHGGVVNKFLGDGMLVVFGAPEAMTDDAPRALAAAEEMLVEAQRMSDAGEFPLLRIGIGLHRGETVLGNVGGAQRQEYTVIGDTVNTASRVQDLTKPLGHPLLLTREIADALADALAGRALEPLGEHLVKGRARPLTLFTLLPAAPARAA